MFSRRLPVLSTIAALIAIAGCLGPEQAKTAAKPREESSVTPADITVLDAAFERAVQSEGAEYAQARAAVLGHPQARAYLVERTKRASGWRERLTAETLLGWIDHKATFDEAFAWLKDESRRPRKTASQTARPIELAKAIARLGREVAPWIIETWLVTREQADDFEETVLELAAGELRDPRFFEPLLVVATAKAEPEPRRISAIYVLEKLSDPRAVPVLIGLLLDTSAPDGVRAAAGSSAAQLEPQAARKPLETVLSDAGSSARLVADVANLLARAYRGDSSVSRLLEQKLELATDTEMIVALANGLGVAGDDKSVEPLRRASTRTTDPQVKTECEDAIRAIEERP
jgi:HEAT repeat protein